MIRIDPQGTPTLDEEARAGVLVSQGEQVMVVQAPEWLTQRGCELRASQNGKSWTVYLRGEPQYLLVLVPASGQHSCRVTQTNNGKRLDNGGVFATPEEAVRGGLEDLRKALGW